MNRAPLFEWVAPEYKTTEKSTDWYWALGILAVAIAVAAILFGNTLFGVLVIVGALAIGLVSKKEAKEHRFALTDEGIVVNRSMWPYESVISFSMVENMDESMPPFLSVKTTSILAPHLLIPVENVDADAVYEFLSGHLTEEDHKPTMGDHLIELLRI